MKLMYGPITAVHDILSQGNNLIVYNLTSLNEMFPRVYLVPPMELGRNNDLQFDINYANWIMYNDPQFVQFMNIISNVYNGYDVFILISEEDWSADLVDSIMKFIQERYGVVGAYVRSALDYIYASEVEFAEGMGLINIQNDMERYGELIYKSTKPNNVS